ncbi:MAG: serine/threonine protein kinase [Planctomycetota bacterium]|nr:MAG: serine/threonine protein kinase [Planctomycetota bacterium]
MDERKFLEILIEKDWIPFEKLRRYQAMVDEFRAFGIKTNLKDLLVNRKALTPEQVEIIQKEMNQSHPNAEPIPPMAPLGTTRTSAITLLKSADLYKESSEEMEAIQLEPLPYTAQETIGLQIGSTVGKYKILGEIGKGGMATVYEAWDSQLKRTVAMKVLTMAKRGKKAMTRFIAEAQATSQLQHPNIIAIHDIGWTPNRLPYFTMDIVKGHSLESVINHLALGDPDFIQIYPRIRLVQIFLKICEGLSFAHSKGVIHRDIKPQNIMVGPFGEVYIMDWGLAKFLKSSASGVWTERQEQVWVTQEGAVVGTPTYMAPEQAKGEVEKVDERTDVYALGAILYELLTLRPPFLSDTIEETYHRVLNEAPHHPKAVSLGPPPPDELSAIALKALSKSRQSRYASVAEMKQDVQRYLDGEPLLAMPDNLWRKSQRWLLKNQVPLLMGLVLFFLVFFLYNIFSRSQDRASQMVAQSWRGILSGYNPKYNLELFEKAFASAKNNQEKSWIWKEISWFHLYQFDLDKGKETLQHWKDESAFQEEALFYQFCLDFLESPLYENKAHPVILKMAKGPAESFTTKFGKIWMEFWNSSLDGKEKALEKMEKLLDSPGIPRNWILASLMEMCGNLGLQYKIDEHKSQSFFNKGEDFYSKIKFPSHLILLTLKSRFDIKEIGLAKEKNNSSLLFTRVSFQEKVKQCLDNLDAALRIKKNQAYFYYLKGVIYFLTNQIGKAREAFEKANELGSKRLWKRELQVYMEKLK